MAETKTILRALAGETLPVPPIWMMRQAGRYLPEYRATRAKAGDFLSLCYTPDLAAEVTLQPIRRYGFDAAILFADILLLPQALGADLWFVTGEGPRLSTMTTEAEFEALNPAEAVHETLNPVYETVRILSRELPAETTLIGFAGAPWTVATYMIAGRGTPDQLSNTFTTSAPWSICRTRYCAVASVSRSIRAAKVSGASRIIPLAPACFSLPRPAIT